MDSFSTIAFPPGKWANKSLQLVSAYFLGAEIQKHQLLLGKTYQLFDFSIHPLSRPGADGFRCSGGWTCLCAQRAGGGAESDSCGRKGHVEAMIVITSLVMVTFIWLGKIWRQKCKLQSLPHFDRR